MSKTIYSTTILLLSLVSVILLYYISVNTFLSGVVLPNVRVRGANVSFMTKAELDSYIADRIIAELPDNIRIAGLEENSRLSTAELIQQISTDNILSYGKGGNIFEVIADGIALLDGEEIKPEFMISTSDLNKGSAENSAISESDSSGKIILDCKNDSYSLVLDSASLDDSIDVILGASTDSLSSSNGSIEIPNDGEIINLCAEANKQRNEIEQAVVNLNVDEEINTADLFEFSLNYVGNAHWEIKDVNLLEQILTEQKSKTDTEPQEGKYETHGDVIYLLKNSVAGKSLNIDKSIAEIAEWLKSPSSNFTLVYDSTDAKGFDSNLTVYDFTKLYAEGKTHLDIIRDGRPNPRIPTAQNGILEMDGKVIMPGEEFSFIGALNFQSNGLTAEGRIIGGGVCNTTTTLFRAALNAGFPITEREPHIFYVPSYEWPSDYQINIVDAAFWRGSPQVDLKFVNDLSYPVMLKSEVMRDGTNWQYHTIRVYTNPQAPSREVILDNWKKWNVRSDTLFNASFDRIVTENGAVLRTDTFKNYYVK